jgi:glycosyltransferase involved in cell wall biosynthesis
VDTKRIQPDPTATGSLVEGLRLRAGDEVVTYVARNLEPYRGFPQFMRAAALILQRRPNTHILVAGGDGTSYGKAPTDGNTFRQQMLADLGERLDVTRIHFLGRVKYEVYLRILQLSAAHIYLSFPFVLSWSMLEAMAAGCLVIGSRTAPVEEVIEDRKNGLLVDFFTPREIADRVDEALDHPERMAPLRRAARQTVLDHYALENCLRQQVQLVTAVARGQMGAVAKRAAPPLAGPKAAAHRRATRIR